MNNEIPRCEPETFTPGDTLYFRIGDPRYSPMLGWTLAYAIRGPSKIDFTATAETNDWLIQIPPATTKTWAPGLYEFQARVTSQDGLISTTIRTGRMTMQKNYASITDESFDPRTAAEVALDALLAAQRGNATRQQQRYQIDGIMVIDLEPLQRIALIEKFQRMVSRERRAANLATGKKPKNKFFIRFRRA